MPMTPAELLRIRRRISNIQLVNLIDDYFKAIDAASDMNKLVMKWVEDTLRRSKEHRRTRRDEDVLEDLVAKLNDCLNYLHETYLKATELIESLSSHLIQSRVSYALSACLNPKKFHAVKLQKGIMSFIETELKFLSADAFILTMRFEELLDARRYQRMNMIKNNNTMY